MKGNDYLGARVTVLRDRESLAAFEVEHKIGAGVRSVARPQRFSIAVAGVRE